MWVALPWLHCFLSPSVSLLGLSQGREPEVLWLALAYLALGQQCSDILPSGEALRKACLCLGEAKWVGSRQGGPPLHSEARSEDLRLPRRAALLWCWVGPRKAPSCWNTDLTTSSSQVRFGGMAPALRALERRAESHVHSHQLPPYPQPHKPKVCACQPPTAPGPDSRPHDFPPALTGWLRPLKHSSARPRVTQLARIGFAPKVLVRPASRGHLPLC